MQTEGTMYRPPVEANTFVFQVAAGCTHNKCKFCTMFRDKKFHLIKEDVLRSNLAEVKEYYGRYGLKLERIFLDDGDVFSLSADKLENIINLVREYFPELKEITMYAAVRSLKHKSDEDLLRLKDLGVNDLYIGYESGVDDCLMFMNKGHNTEVSIRQAERLNQVGIRHHALLIIGMAGKGRAEESGMAAARLINQIKPGIVLLTTLSVFDDSDLKQEIINNNFTEAKEKEILTEELVLLDNINDGNIYFWASHSLNSVPMEGYIYKDRENMRRKLQYAIENIDEETFAQQLKRERL